MDPSKEGNPTGAARSVEAKREAAPGRERRRVPQRTDRVPRDPPLGDDAASAPHAAPSRLGPHAAPGQGRAVPAAAPLPRRQELSESASALPRHGGPAPGSLPVRYSRRLAPPALTCRAAARPRAAAAPRASPPPRSPAAPRTHQSRPGRAAARGLPGAVVPRPRRSPGRRAEANYSPRRAPRRRGAAGETARARSCPTEFPLLSSPVAVAARSR